MRTWRSRSTHRLRRDAESEVRVAKERGWLLPRWVRRVVDTDWSAWTDRAELQKLQARAAIQR